MNWLDILRVEECVERREAVGAPSILQRRHRVLLDNLDHLE